MKDESCENHHSDSHSFECWRKAVHFFRVLCRRWKDSISSLKRFPSHTCTLTHTQTHPAQICHNMREGTGKQAEPMQGFQYWEAIFFFFPSYKNSSIKMKLEFHNGLKYKRICVFRVDVHILKWDILLYNTEGLTLQLVVLVCSWTTVCHILLWRQKVEEIAWKTTLNSVKKH